MRERNLKLSDPKIILVYFTMEGSQDDFKWPLNTLCLAYACLCRYKRWRDKQSEKRYQQSNCAGFILLKDLERNLHSLRVKIMS